MRFCRRERVQLRASQLEFLLSVALKPGQTQTELATDCGVTLSAISRAMDVLGSSGRRDSRSAARMGWVETRKDPDDDRVQLVHLTQSGREFVSLLETICYGSPIHS